MWTRCSALRRRERAAERELKKRHALWEARKAEHEAASGAEVPEPGPEPTLGDCAADIERKRLFSIVEDLVRWENTTNEHVLEKARVEIWQSWRRACANNADHPRATDLFNRNKLPAFHDPFAGGGALPLEAQRLGLEVWASDLNPVAVLINKAMIEIPSEVRRLTRPLIQNVTCTSTGRAPKVSPRMYATTEIGCATRQRSGSAISTPRSRLRLKWPSRAARIFTPMSVAKANRHSLGSGHAQSRAPIRRSVMSDVPLTVNFHALALRPVRKHHVDPNDRERRLPVHRESWEGRLICEDSRRLAPSSAAAPIFSCLMSGSPD